MFAGAAAHGSPVDQAEAIERLDAEMDVLRHRQVAHGGQFLMDHADTGRPGISRRRVTHRAPVETHLALIVDVHAGDDLHQRGLAGAVLADQPVDLAGAATRNPRRAVR